MWLHFVCVHLEKRIRLPLELPVVRLGIRDQSAKVVEFEIALLVPGRKDQRKNIQGSIDKQSFCFCTKKESIEIALKDQFPISTDKEITIELLENGKAKVNIENGIIDWDLKLAANETKKIRICYKVRYPKDKIIDNL